MTEKKALNTDEVIARLAARHPSDQYGFVTQLRNGAGFSATRTMDAMAMSLWPSRGLHVTGFEVKVSRTDFIREIRNPAKADELACYCDYWYIVVGDEKIVQLGDLPPTWGLMVPHKDGLKIAKEAAKLKPKPIDASLLAALFKNLQKNMIPLDSVKARIDAAQKQGVEVGEARQRRVLDQKESLEKRIREFEKASGVTMDSWRSGKEIGDAVRAVLDGRDKVSERRLKDLHESAKNIVKFIDGEIKAYQI